MRKINNIVLTSPHALHSFLKQDYHGSYSDLDSEHMKMGDMEYDHKASAAATGGLSYGKKLSRYQSGSRESYSSRDSRETYSQDTQVFG